jgi:hypothetical protein
MAKHFDDDEKFREWIRALDEDVIQGEYGYEDGEFTVYSDDWHPMYAEGLTPAAAFKRALDAFAKDRRAKRRDAREHNEMPERDNARAD